MTVDGEAAEPVVVRLSFANPRLRSGLDELRNDLQRHEVFRRRVSLVSLPDDRPTLGVHEVLEIVVDLASSDVTVNVLGGMFGGAAQSVVNRWLDKRQRRSAMGRSGTAAAGDGGLAGVGVWYVVDNGRVGLDMRLSDRPAVNDAVIDATRLLVEALRTDAPSAPTSP